MDEWNIKASTNDAIVIERPIRSLKFDSMMDEIFSRYGERQASWVWVASIET